MISYVLRIVSTSSRSGKTELGTRLASHLLKMGYDVAVVKHCSHGVDVEVKDTLRYIQSGVKLVVAISRDMLVTYESQAVEDLRYVLRYVNKPIVLVEGFKDQAIGDSIGVVRSLDDFRELTNVAKNLNAIVTNDEDVVKAALNDNITVFKLGDYDSIVKWVEERALNEVSENLPKKDCGVCGFTTCKSFAKAYLKGLTRQCPVIADVRLVVDDVDVSLNPFVKKLISSLVNGFLDSLKDVPLRRRRILLEINY